MNEYIDLKSNFLKKEDVTLESQKNIQKEISNHIRNLSDTCQTTIRNLSENAQAFVRNISETYYYKFIRNEWILRPKSFTRA